MSEPDRDENGSNLVDEPPVDEDGDFASEHASLIVDDFALDRPAEPDATP